ncbi:nitroreductase/quinone reductase family protein [soil metagenome]
MPNLKDQLFRIGTSLHEAVFRATNGRVTGRAGGMPVLMLTTTGRKSGKARTTMLTAPLHDDDRTVLVASYGGDDRHPAWFLNLREHPEVEVMMDGGVRSMRARVASSGEKAELWPEVVAAYKGYAGYEKRSRRDIPLVILEPA